MHRSEGPTPPGSGPSAGRVVPVRELLKIYQEHRARHPKGTFRMPVEAMGMARTPAALRSGIDSSPCIYYEYVVERMWKRRQREGALPLLADQDASSGQDVLMAKRRSCGIFWLADRDDEVTVDPEGAVFESETVVERFERVGLASQTEAKIKVKEFPYVLTADLDLRVDAHTLGFKFIERVIPLNRVVVVRGLATDETGTLTLRRHPGATPPLIVRIERT